MAIDYIEIRNNNREIIDIMDTANSIIWHDIYFGVGDFEIYIQATPKNINRLKKGYYVNKPNDDVVGIIEKIDITNNPIDGLMIVASGRFAKSILDRRLIYRLSGKQNVPSILRNRVENAVRTVVQGNIISCDWDTRRNVSFLELGANAGITKIIVDESGNAAQKQVSYENLLTYTDGVLQEYGMSAKVILNDDTKKLQYVVFEGTDRSVDNVAGIEPLIFSREYDNLTESEYMSDESTEKNVALIGGEGEGTARFYSLLAGTESGLARRELFVDGSSINKTYKDDSDVEHTYTDAEYRTMLNALGKQELSKHKKIESFSGSINTTFGVYKLNEDYFIGDIVTVQDNQINKYANVRITEVTEVQDENGYSVTVNYE